MTSKKRIFSTLKYDKNTPRVKEPCCKINKNAQKLCRESNKIQIGLGEFT